MPNSRDKSHQCVLWTHNDSFSRELILFNSKNVANGSFASGLLLSIEPLPQHHAADEVVEPLVFRVHDIPQALAKKDISNLQVSIHDKIAKLYGFRRRMPVMLSKAGQLYVQDKLTTLTRAQADPKLHAASHVELSYRDVQLDRSDMWRLCSLHLHNQPLFQGQTITFLGTIKLTVKSVYVRGHKVRSGVFTDLSRPVFRSETARYIVMLQMSKEMWDFDIEGSGEILWTRCIDGFLPDLFEHWTKVNARHIITVVLFTRLQYNRGQADAYYRDYYRVVASEVPSSDSTILLQRVRQDYVHFLRKVETQFDGDAEVVKGIPSTAAQGNFLEAVNLATSHLSREANDLDLLRTESSIIVVSPGVALMEADRDILRLTTERAISSGFAVDLVCLAQQPLHAVPLFKIRKSRQTGKIDEGQDNPFFSTSGPFSSPTQNRSGLTSSLQTGTKIMYDPADWSFIRPSWVVTTFYSQGTSGKRSRKNQQTTYLPTCRMYQIQSMGVSQNGKRLTMPRLDITASDDNAPQSFETHDKDVFKRRQETSAATRSRTTTVGVNADANPEMERSRRESLASLRSAASSQATPQLTPRKLSPERAVSSQAYSRLRREASPAPSISSMASKKSLGFLRFNKAINKASVTTSATVESAESDLMRHRQDNATPSSNGHHGSISRQFKLSLSRTASATAPSQITTPSQPIPIAPSPRLVPADRPKSSHVVPVEATPKPWSLDKDDAFRSASLSKRNSNSLERGYMGTKLSATPREHISPWLIEMKPADATPRGNDTFAGWKHVFVPTTIISAVKWTTLSCPATLPLTTECVPPAEVLRSTAYTESPYIVSLDETDERGRTKTLMELVTRRISKGFQLGVGAGASELSGFTGHDNSIFSPSFAKDSSASIVMVRGNTVHLLSCDDNGVAVTRFQSRHTSKGSTGIKYEPKISTIMDDNYHGRQFQISVPQEENWNAIDNYIVGQHAPNPLTSSLGSASVNRIRFVLLPVDIPGPRKNIPFANEDSDEELRLEGIRKLTMLWQGVRSFQREPSRGASSGPSKAELSPLAIEYQTKDPSIVITQGLENSPLVEGNQTVTAKSLFGDSEAYKTTKVDLHKLAIDLQGPKGIKMRDRRWHLRMHAFCFEGVELVSFLLANFVDLTTRDSAIDFGNVLMGKGLFEHVQSKHRFRDGHFFYNLAPEYRAQRNESRGWFSRKPETSSPMIAAADSQKIFSPSMRPVEDRSSLGLPGSHSNKPKVMLSAVINFDVDPGPRPKSDRPENIKIHYDRLHNPEAAFHILLEWENTTSRLIEEQVSSWSIAVEKHGLKMVQVPMQEIAVIGRANPFRTPYIIKLAVRPPKDYIQRPPDESTTEITPLPPTERHKHMKIILRKNGYVLDYEASFRFPSTVDVTYSWGEPSYIRDQYIHRSGRALAQIVDDETLIVMVNRLSTSRNSSAKYEKDPVRPSTGAYSRQAASSNRPDPFSSPHLRPTWQQSRKALPAAQQVTGPLSPSLQHLKESLEAYCHNREILLALYDELAPNQFQNTPSQKAARTPSLDGSIPSLELPPISDVDTLNLNEAQTHAHLDTVVEDNESEARPGSADPHRSPLVMRIPGK